MVMIMSYTEFVTFRVCPQLFYCSCVPMLGIKFPMVALCSAVNDVYVLCFLGCCAACTSRKIAVLFDAVMVSPREVCLTVGKDPTGWK